MLRPETHAKFDWSAEVVDAIADFFGDLRTRRVAREENVCLRSLSYRSLRAKKRN